MCIPPPHTATFRYERIIGMIGIIAENFVEDVIFIPSRNATKSRRDLKTEKLFASVKVASAKNTFSNYNYNQDINYNQFVETISARN